MNLSALLINLLNEHGHAVKSFVTERAVDFITILEQDLPRQSYEHYFHELFPAF